MICEKMLCPVFTDNTIIGIHFSNNRTVVVSDENSFMLNVGFSFFEAEFLSEKMEKAVSL
jgi:hypothetical protein